MHEERDDLDQVRAALRSIRVFRTQLEMDIYAETVAMLPLGEQAVWRLLGDSRADALSGLNVVVSHSGRGLQAVSTSLRSALALWPEIPLGRDVCESRGATQSKASTAEEFHYWSDSRTQELLVESSTKFGESFSGLLLVPASASVIELEEILPAFPGLTEVIPFQMLGLAKAGADALGWAGYEIVTEPRMSIFLFRPDLQEAFECLVEMLREREIASMRVWGGACPAIESIVPGVC